MVQVQHKHPLIIFIDLLMQKTIVCFKSFFLQSLLWKLVFADIYSHFLYYKKSQVNVRLNSFKIATFGSSFSSTSTQQKQRKLPCLSAPIYWEGYGQLGAMPKPDSLVILLYVFSVRPSQNTSWIIQQINNPLRAENLKWWAIKCHKRAPLETAKILWNLRQLLSLQMTSCHVSHWFLSTLTRTILSYLRGVAGPCVKYMFASLWDQ